MFYVPFTGPSEMPERARSDREGRKWPFRVKVARLAAAQAALGGGQAVAMDVGNRRRVSGPRTQTCRAKGYSKPSFQMTSEFPPSTPATSVAMTSTT